MMKKPILILLFLIAVGVAKAQTNDTTKPALNDTSKKFMPVDVLPSFPGGFEKFDVFLAKNENAGANEGKVRVSFVVETDGSLSEIKITKSLSEDADKEAIRLVSLMPKWNPGIQGGHPVRVRYELPILFPAK